MAQSKHTFVESKMNKDLDDRLLSGGQYRNAINAAVSKSEDSDVGALENVLGNFEISNLFPDSLTPYLNLETIGGFLSSDRDTIYLFLTNFCDTSTTGLGLKAPSGANCLIVEYNVTTEVSKILVEGNFLNFSNTHRITGVNVIEDLLFFTDNRNQPRKISITRARQNSTYYTTEDQISIIKYAPYTPISVLETSTFDGVDVTNSTVNGVASSNLSDGTTDFSDKASLYDSFSLQSGLYNIAAFDSSGNIEIIPQISTSTAETITIFKNNAVDKTSEWLPPTARIEIRSSNTSPTTVDGATDIQGTSGLSVYWLSPRVIPYQVAQDATGFTGSYTFDSDAQSNILNPILSSKIALTFNTAIDPTSSTYITSLFLQQGVTINENTSLFIDICLPNPHYDTNFAGDKNNLKDKFVRFSYRYKFDDNEYSIMAPFTQPIFIPQQDGYFLNTTEDYNNIPTSVIINQPDEAGESTVVNWFENKINQIKFNFDFEYKVQDVNDKLKIKELQILYKESDGLAVKIIDDIDFSQNNLLVVNNTTNTFSYTYQSAKPFKTLPADVITRTGDKAPIRALAQETSGNRIIYGNYVDKHTSPLTLNYLVSSGEKLGPSASGTSNAFAQYPNHTLKQNRTYQVGIVLQDRYGRQSDVILAPPLDGPLLEVPSGSGNFYGDSTIYHSYKGPDFWKNTLEWKGDSLKVLFRNSIPEILPNRPGYPGLYSADNPLGWYSYKIVVKQKQQEYYNVYLPSLLYGTPIGQSVDVEWSQLCSSQNNSGYANSKFVAANSNTLPGLDSTLALKPGMRFKLTSGYWDGTPSSGTDTVHTITKILDNETIEFSPNNGNTPVTAFCPADTALNCCEKETSPFDDPGLINSQPQSFIQFFAANVLNVGLTTANETNEFTTTLLTDNLNKLPADLEDIRPNQLQFKTSEDVIYPRVGRLLSQAYIQYVGTDEAIGGCYFASTLGIGEQSDNIKVLGNYDDIFPYNSRSSNLYKESNNPNTGIFTNTFQIGTESLAPAVFSVIETEPVISELDIFWETSTTGLISVLNSFVISVDDVNGIGGNLFFSQNENEAASSTSPLNVGKVFAVDGNGATIASGGIVLISVFDGLGNEYSSDYQLGTVANNEYPLEAINPCVFTSNPNRNNRIFTFQVTDTTQAGNTITNNYTYTTSILNAQPNPLGVVTTSGTGKDGYVDNPVETSGVDYNFPSPLVIVGDVQTQAIGTLTDNRIYADNGSVAEFFVNQATINEFTELKFELQVSLNDDFTQLVSQNNTVTTGSGSSSSGSQTRSSSTKSSSGSSSNTISYPAYDGIYLIPSGQSSNLYTPSSYNIPNGVVAHRIMWEKAIADQSNPVATFSNNDVRYVRVKISDCNGINGTSFVFLGSNLSSQDGIKITFIDGSGSGSGNSADGEIIYDIASGNTTLGGQATYKTSETTSFISGQSVISQSTEPCTGSTPNSSSSQLKIFI